MGDRELRTKYGGKLPKAINRAIRAEVPGGNEALEKLTQLAGAARQSRWKDHAGKETPEATAYFRHKRDVVDRMDAEVRRRWGVPPDKDTSPRGGESTRTGATRHQGPPGKSARRAGPPGKSAPRQGTPGKFAQRQGPPGRSERHHGPRGKSAGPGGRVRGS